MQSKMRVSYIQCHSIQMRQVHANVAIHCISHYFSSSSAYGNRMSLTVSFSPPPLHADENPMLDTSQLLVTASHSIFQKEDNKEAPVAVVGYQFQHSALHGLFKNISTTSVSKRALESTIAKWQPPSVHLNSRFASIHSVVRIVQDHVSRIQSSIAIYWTIMDMWLLQKTWQTLVNFLAKSRADWCRA